MSVRAQQRAVDGGGADSVRLPRPFEAGRFRVRVAGSAGDLDAVKRLRFEVFNVELREGLAQSWRTRRDEDEFDAQFHHLLVEDLATGRVAGTYRVQTAGMAAGGRGFYAQTEFDLETLPPEVLERSVEAGRACIAKEHRNQRVLFLLWRGLAAYLEANDKRIVFGCSSITSSDPAVGVAAFAGLERSGQLHPLWRVHPLAGLECRADRPGDPVVLPEVTLPILFRTYLRFGGSICGPPAIDRAFQTIDFFTLVEVDRLEPDQRRLFF